MSREDLQSALDAALDHLSQDDQAAIARGADPEASPEATAAKILWHAVHGISRVQMHAEGEQPKQVK